MKNNSPPRSAGGIAPPLGGESALYTGPSPCQHEAMEREIDYRGLIAAVSAGDVNAYRAAERLRNPAAEGRRITAIVITIVSAILGTVVLASFLLPSLVVLGAGVVSGADPRELVLIVPPIIIAMTVIVLVVRFLRGSRSVWSDRVRMSRFASANGFVFETESAGPSYPGAIFGLGSSRLVTDHFRTTEDRFLDFGNYRYVTGSGKSRTTHQWGFLALSLDRALPHMVLDSRANNGLLGSTNLPAVFSREQVLSLEGDFDRYFTLYCPAEYERDALYVFTPDLMALLVDEAAPFDVEIVDQWMFVYSVRPFPLADPTTYQRLLRIVSTVGAKTLTQTDRYVDERIGAFGPNVVAPQGQRLRRGFSWVSVAVIALFLVIWFGGIFSNFLN